MTDLQLAGELVRDARDEALEEAAKIAETCDAWPQSGFAAKTIALRIRALKSSSQQ